ncbi:MAG: hypothetical protein HY451_00720 [Parcubacteria group bacterium]|nr:hypothetical protein [Parcubacteria group bacterium]
MEINKTKKLVLLTIAVSTMFLISHNELEGQVVEVHDSDAISLLQQLVKKEYELDPQARGVARETLESFSNYIINVVKQMGRKGDINDTGQVNVFVNNWRNFALEGQYRAEDLWRGILYVAAYGDQGLQIPPLLCDYIKNSPAFRSLLPNRVNNLIQSRIQRKVGTLEEYLVASKCDSFVNQNYQTFLNDFNAGGGWEMLEKLSQPQNNIYGSIDLAMAELERQRQIEEQSDLQEANSGSGYLGRRQCLATGPAGQCVIWSNVNLPADLAVAALGAVINQNLAFVSGADEFKEDQEATKVKMFEIMKNIFGELATLK